MKLELYFLHCFSSAVARECNRYEEILSENNFCARLCFLRGQLKIRIVRPQICEVGAGLMMCRDYQRLRSLI